jgi:hypothetical protein
MLREDSNLRYQNCAQEARADAALFDRFRRLHFFERVSALHGITIFDGQKFKCAPSLRDTPPIALAVFIPDSTPSVYVHHKVHQGAANKIIKVAADSSSAATGLAEAVSQQLWCTYSFPEHLFQGAPSAGRAEVIKHGRLVSSCSSSIEDAFTAEAFVRTAAVFQGHGYGTRVTLAWAREVSERGKTPVFSCRADNMGSLGVASKLGLTLVFKEMRVWRVGR